MEKAELMKVGAQGYIHDLACKIADSLKAGDMEEERDYNRGLHTTIRAYLEAGILTEAEATQPVCEAYRESFSQTEEPKVNTAGRDELFSSMRKIALDDVYSTCEKAAKARTEGKIYWETAAREDAKCAIESYVKLGLISREEGDAQCVAAYQDYGVTTAEQEAGSRPADGVQVGRKERAVRK